MDRDVFPVMFLHLDVARPEAQRILVSSHEPKLSFFFFCLSNLGLGCDWEF